MAGNKFFFSQTQDAPKKLTPETIYMAVLYNGKVIPDKRSEPNPANAPLPSGVEEYSPEAEFESIIGSPPDDPSPLAVASLLDTSFNF